MNILRPNRWRPPSVDQVRGTILGAAIGDAMGHPTEFLSVEEIRARFGSEGVTKYELYWTREGRRFAPYTDDTQMAEIVLRTLLWSRRESATLDETMRAMAQGFVQWAAAPQGGHRSPGNACLHGCRRLAEGARWYEAGALDAGGCGSVMRAYPFGVVFFDDVAKAEEWAVGHSKLTHGAPIALAACAAMAAGVASALGGAFGEDVIEAMRKAAGRYDQRTSSMIGDAFMQAATGAPPDTVLTRLQGWAAHEAIAGTAYIFSRHVGDVRGAILEGANAPGDSDSLASMAGALAGASVGLRGVPADWIAELERADDLDDLATEAARIAHRPFGGPG